MGGEWQSHAKYAHIDCIKNNTMIRKLIRQMLAAQVLSALTVSVCLLVDSIMVSHFYGEPGMAAYGLANPLLLVIGAIGSMLSSGVQVACSRSLGKGDQEETNVGYATTLAVVAAVNMLILPWLSTESLDLVDDGNMLDRSQKTALVADYEPATRYLNVCYGHDTLDANCSVCGKCRRTLLTLEILGKLDAFGRVFDVDRYRREVRRRLIAETIVGEKSNLFARHLMDLARERKVDLRREVNCLDLFRARMMNGRLHTFIRNNPFLKRLAKKFFK